MFFLVKVAGDMGASSSSCAPPPLGRVLGAGIGCEILFCPTMLLPSLSPAHI